MPTYERDQLDALIN
jgi:Leucine-rich repeat (LRR) protein